MKITAAGLYNCARGTVAFFAVTAIPLPAYAQEMIGILEEIVVIAQKREQNIMDVPVAMTAVTGALIEDTSIKAIDDLQQYVPGLIVGRPLR